MATATKTGSDLEQLLGADARALLDHKCKTIDKSLLHLPGPDFIDRVWAVSDRSPRVLVALQSIFD